MIEALSKRLRGYVGDTLEQSKRHVLANHRCNLQEVLFVWRETVDPSRQHRLNGGGDLDGAYRLRQPVSASLSHQRLGLHQCPDSLLDEERVPALDEELLEWNVPRIVTE